MQTLSHKDDLAKLLSSNKRVALLTFRGAWCPFCRKQLKELRNLYHRAMAADLSLYGISADSIAIHQQLMEELELTFPLISDASLLTAKHFDGPICDSHGRSPRYPQGAFLQPAFYLIKEGQVHFSWQHRPSLFNLQGAVLRISSKKIMQRIASTQ